LARSEIQQDFSKYFAYLTILLIWSHVHEASPDALTMSEPERQKRSPSLAFRARTATIYFGAKFVNYCEIDWAPRRAPTPTIKNVTATMRATALTA
jgi:hypothetical protein